MTLATRARQLDATLAVDEVAVLGVGDRDVRPARQPLLLQVHGVRRGLSGDRHRLRRWRARSPPGINWFAGLTAAHLSLRP